MAGLRPAPVPAAIDVLASGLAELPEVPALPIVLLPEPELMPPLDPIALDPMLPEELPVPGAPRALLPTGPDEAESLLPEDAPDEPMVLLPGVALDPMALLLPVVPELPMALLPMLALPGVFMQGVSGLGVVVPVVCARTRPLAANDEAANSIANFFLLAFMSELLDRVDRKKSRPCGTPCARKARIPAVRTPMPTPLVSH